MHPLYEAFPALTAHLPVVAIADLPTPVQRLGSRDNAWIKRDDLSHPLYGGNKIRKLEFILAEWRERNIREVITFGALGTNAGLATALICHQENIRCRILLFDQPLTDTVRNNLAAMQQLGVTFEYCGSLGRCLRRFYLHPLRLRPSRYFLFAGCANPPATFAYLNAAFELQRQIIQGQCPEPAAIVLPVGSSSTLAGLTLGAQLAGLRSRVLGVRVAPRRVGPFAACTTASVRAQMANALHRLHRAGIRLPTTVHDPLLLDHYYGTGYGHPLPAGQQAAQHFRDQFGITLEQTYSAKAAACFLDQLTTQTGPVLFWNTFNSRPLENLPRAHDIHYTAIAAATADDQLHWKL